MKVSVCLASYNGEPFVEEQLRSILADLRADDELILCDDASTDRTVSLARAIDDRRLTVHAFTDNVRHVRNFERALTFAKGELIFLSDQDDIWEAGKRNAVVSVFEENEDVVTVVHALSLIDRDGHVLEQRSRAWPASDEGARSGLGYLVQQIVRNQVTGCAVAFRRRLLDLLLPFPSDVYAHDHWISVASPFSGKVWFLNRMLVRYRQHSANVTPKGGLNVVDRMRVRVKLAKLVGIAASRARRARSLPAQT